VKLSPDVRNTYKSLIECGLNNNLGESHALFTTFRGANCTSRPLLIVGRDTNGNDYNINKYMNDKNQVFAPQSYGSKELSWMKKEGGYYFGSSAFWRTALKIHSMFRYASSNKPDHTDYGYDSHQSIVWSNLYRLSPCDRSSPTKGKVKRLQFNLCNELLLHEITQLNPCGIFFLTGNFINPFLSAWQKNEFIENLTEFDHPWIKVFDFNINGIKIPTVVVNHPQGKKEAPLIKSVIDFFSNKTSFQNIVKRNLKYKEACTHIIYGLNSKSEDNPWWVYQYNDVGRHFKIERYEIGIESCFKGNETAVFQEFRIKITSWNKKNGKFLETKLQPILENILKNQSDNTFNFAEWNGSRYEIYLTPLSIGPCESPNIIQIKTQLESCHKSLNECKRIFEKKDKT
jgi:hypothetical protein